jgi:hypothetical protein
MAFLKFRGNTTSPTKPGSTTAANAPLTNTEIDGNFASLNDGKLESSGTANHTGNITFGNQTSLQGTGGTNGSYTNNNLNKLVFRPTIDLDGSTFIGAADALRFQQWLAGLTISVPFIGAPYIIQHADKANTGIAMLHADPLAFGIGNDQNPSIILTAGDTAVTQYVRIGGASSTNPIIDFATALPRADLALKATTVLVNSTTASTSTFTGSLVLGGGLGVSGAVYATSAVLTNALPATSGGTGINNGSSTITIGGNVTMSGAYTFTGTLTANTSVTFPTTGTLVNSAVTTLSSLASVGTITTGTWNANIIGATYGGTGTGTYATGDILYASATNTLSKLTIGSAGQLLTVSGGVPTWTTVQGGATITNDTTSNGNNYYPAMATATSGTLTSATVSSTKLYFNPSTGTLNSTDYNSLSDARFKTDLEKIEGALSKVKQLTGYTFTMTESGKRSAGLLAQDVKPVSPESIGGTEDRMTLNYDSLFGLIVEAIKEIDDKLTSIKHSLDK